MSKVFHNSKGDQTLIVGSREFAKTKFAERNKMAFAKNGYEDLSSNDKAALIGYAKGLSDAKKSSNAQFRKKNPNYVKKTGYYGSLTVKK
jgi:hypothetical protein